MENVQSLQKNLNDLREKLEKYENEQKEICAQIKKLPNDASEKLRNMMQEKADNLKKEIKELKELIKLEKEKIKQLKKEIKDAKEKERKQMEAEKEAERKAKKEAKDQIATNSYDFQLADGKVVNRKAAYIGYNRSIDWNAVDEYIKLISSDDYEADYPILVYEAEVFHVEHPLIDVVDASGEPIAEEELSNYFVFLDGQHRGQAFMYLINLGKNKKIKFLPNIKIKRGIPDIPHYLWTINPNRSWTIKDKSEVSALGAPEKYKGLCSAMYWLIKDGVSPSTAEKILAKGNRLSKMQRDALVRGKEPQKEIYFDIESGMRFVKLCKEKNIDTKYLKKRYFVDGFWELAKGRDTSRILVALEKMPPLSEEELKGIKGEGDFIKKVEPYIQ